VRQLQQKQQEKASVFVFPPYYKLPGCSNVFLSRIVERESTAEQAWGSWCGPTFIVDVTFLIVSVGKCSAW